MPGIKLYLKNTKQEIDFWGNDTEEDIIEFINDNINNRNEL